MRTIFHVGHAKTGTTALQAIMEASRGALLERGVLYPSNPSGTYRNHRLIFADLFEPWQIPRHVLKNFAPEELPAARAELCEGIRREIAEHRPDCVVMSSESRFAVWSDAQRKGFLAALAEVGCREAEIVAYIRRPSSWYLSAVQQHLRASYEVKPLRMLRLAAALEQFAEDFGHGNVHVRPFDRGALVGGDIAEDFVAAFLAPHGVEAAALRRPKQDNSSLSAESFDLARRWRQAFHPDEPNRHLASGAALNRILARVEVEIAPPRPVMDPELAELVDYCRDDLLLLRDRFGLELPGYDYARLERGELTRVPQEVLPIERIVTIDRAVQARIAARLRDTRWAAEDPARLRWLGELPDRIEAERQAKRRLAEIGGREAVGPREGGALRALWTPRAPIGGGRVAAFGGALAEAVGPALGHTWIDEEPAPAGLPEARARRRGHGRHSARTGAIPTATLFERWTAWAAGEAEPPEALRRAGGRVHDALRPGVPPTGFASPEEALADRRETLAALARALAGADAVVVEPVTALALHDAAGTEVAEEAAAAGRAMQEVHEIARALAEAAARIRRMSPGARVLLALSPVVGGCVVAQGEARAVLRAAMGAVARGAEGVEYVPTAEAALEGARTDAAAAAELAALLRAVAEERAPRPRAAAV